MSSFKVQKKCLVLEKGTGSTLHTTPSVMIDTKSTFDIMLKFILQQFIGFV